MASTSGVSTAALIPTIIILLAVINTVIVTAVRESELTVMFGVLRARGYHLFANAITTSDVHYDLRSDGNFTLLAPINSALFALDMTMPATNYVTTLRYHVIPRRMSMIDLLSLPPSSNTIPTLVPGRDIRVEQRRSARSLITVGGVDIVVSGMFYGTHLAVHGLGGILEYRHHTRRSPANSTVTGASLSNFSGNFTLQSPPVYNITGNYTFQFPVAIESPLSSHQSQNQTVTPPDVLQNQVPIRSESFEVMADERMRRGKLLEVRSDGEYSGLEATDLSGDHVQQLVMEDDETLDCSLGDDVGELMNAGIDLRRLDVCAQK
ncbi:putative FAS1 domain-containing protein [Helianthus debilis subsp. tardiflorus]